MFDEDVVCLDSLRKAIERRLLPRVVPTPLVPTKRFDCKKCLFCCCLNKPWQISVPFPIICYVKGKFHLFMCPLIVYEDGQILCSIYEQRPKACRKYFCESGKGETYYWKR